MGSNPLKMFATKLIRYICASSSLIWIKFVKVNRSLIFTDFLGMEVNINRVVLTQSRPHCDCRGICIKLWQPSDYIFRPSYPFQLYL